MVMSLSHEWWEYHLTPKGWIEGSKQLDFGGEQKKDIPKDRVLSVRFHERLASAFSKSDDWYEEFFRSPNNKELVQSLITKFGALPINDSRYYRKD